MTKTEERRIAFEQAVIDRITKRGLPEQTVRKHYLLRRDDEYVDVVICEMWDFWNLSYEQSGNPEGLTAVDHGTTPPARKIYLLFASVDGSTRPRFLEIHDEDGNTIEVGEWAADGDHERLALSIAPNEEIRPAPAVDRCFICAEPLKEGDIVLPDYDGGTGHRACFGEQREGFCNLETGEPLAPDEPLPEGYAYQPDPKAAEG